MNRGTHLAALAFSLLVAGCGGGDEPLCTPGASVACVGTGGCAGGQVCNADGTGFGACSCGPGPDGGTNDSGMNDSGTTDHGTNEDAAVVWGKVISWIVNTDYLELKSEFYDEDGYLVNTMLGKDIKFLGGKLLPARLEVIPADEEGNKTVMEYLWIEFDKPIEESFFSVQNLKKIQ